MEEIHLQLTRKMWEELKVLRDKIEEDMPECLKDDTEPNTYEEYLEKEKKKPTMVLFG